MAAQCALDQRLHAGPHVGQDVEERLAQHPRAGVVEQAGEGGVVQENQLRTPHHVHGEFRFEDEAGCIAQRGTPAGRRADRATLPVMDMVPGPDGTGAAEEVESAGCSFHADRSKGRKRSFYAETVDLERGWENIHFPRKKNRCRPRNMNISGEHMKWQCFGG